MNHPVAISACLKTSPTAPNASEIVSVYERFVATISEAFGAVGDVFRQALIATGWFTSLGDELVIRTPDLFISFQDYLTGVFEADAKMEAANVEAVLDATDSLYEKITDLCDRYSGLDFDVDKFRELAEKIPSITSVIRVGDTSNFSQNSRNLSTSKSRPE